jgi:hypothetical protein
MYPMSTNVGVSNKMSRETVLLKNRKTFVQSDIGTGACAHSWFKKNMIEMWTNMGMLV